MTKHVQTQIFNNSQITTLPNGSDISNPNISIYVDRYRSFLRKTAESVLGLAETLLEAKTTLNGVDFNIFCDQVGTPEGGSTYHKLMKIAENITRFQPVVEKLPNSWTTIYKLAKLPSEKFEYVSSNLSPFITAKELNTLVGQERESRSHEQFDIKLSFDAMLPEQKARVYQEIDRLKAEFNFKIQETLNFKNELKQFKTVHQI